MFFCKHKWKVIKEEKSKPIREYLKDDVQISAQDLIIIEQLFKTETNLILQCEKCNKITKIKV